MPVGARMPVDPRAEPSLADPELSQEPRWLVSHEKNHQSAEGLVRDVGGSLHSSDRRASVQTLPLSKTPLRTDLFGHSPSYYPGTKEPHTSPTRQRGICGDLPSLARRAGIGMNANLSCRSNIERFSPGWTAGGGFRRRGGQGRGKREEGRVKRKKEEGRVKGKREEQKGRRDEATGRERKEIIRPLRLLCWPALSSPFFLDPPYSFLFPLPFFIFPSVLVCLPTPPCEQAASSGGARIYSTTTLDSAHSRRFRGSATSAASATTTATRESGWMWRAATARRESTETASSRSANSAR